WPIVDRLKKLSPHLRRNGFATESQEGRIRTPAMPTENDFYCRPDGTRVKQLRTQRGWTQEELARKAGPAKRTIENIEKAERLRRRIMEEVAQALGVPVEEISAPHPDECSGGDPSDGSRKGKKADSVPARKQPVVEIILKINVPAGGFTDEEGDKVL